MKIKLLDGKLYDQKDLLSKMLDDDFIMALCTNGLLFIKH